MNKSQPRAGPIFAAGNLPASDKNSVVDESESLSYFCNFQLIAPLLGAMTCQLIIYQLIVFYRIKEFKYLSPFVPILNLLVLILYIITWFNYNNMLSKRNYKSVQLRIMELILNQHNL